MTNPQFLPRDEFYQLFVKLKNLEMYYSVNEEEVWEAFTSSPVQPFELQARVSTQFSKMVKILEIVQKKLVNGNKIGHPNTSHVIKVGRRKEKF